MDKECYIQRNTSRYVYTTLEVQMRYKTIVNLIFLISFSFCMIGCSKKKDNASTKSSTSNKSTPTKGLEVISTYKVSDLIEDLGSELLVDKDDFKVSNDKVTMTHRMNFATAVKDVSKQLLKEENCNDDCTFKIIDKFIEAHSRQGLNDSSKKSYNKKLATWSKGVRHFDEKWNLANTELSCSCSFKKAQYKKYLESQIRKKLIAEDAVILEYLISK